MKRQVKRLTVATAIGTTYKLLRFPARLRIHPKCNNDVSRWLSTLSD